jgi:hypothetical protein
MKGQMVAVEQASIAKEVQYSIRGTEATRDLIWLKTIPVPGNRAGLGDCSTMWGVRHAQNRYLVPVLGDDS